MEIKEEYSNIIKSKNSIFNLIQKQSIDDTSTRIARQKNVCVRNMTSCDVTSRLASSGFYTLFVKL